MRIAEKSYDEIVDLFARGSTPAEIMRFRPSPAVQERARYLLEQYKIGALTGEEADELERLGQLEHMMQLVKARARLHAEPQS